jgi:hypothetical protein
MNVIGHQDHRMRPQSIQGGRLKKRKPQDLPDFLKRYREWISVIGPESDVIGQRVGSDEFSSRHTVPSAKTVPTRDRGVARMLLD